jgi:hypothetical protein
VGGAAADLAELFEGFSIFGSVSRGRDGRLLFFGSRTVIDEPGEPLWSDATQGLKPNELIWSSSRDDGQTWEPFQVIPQPIPGSAEAPGALCETGAGRLLGTGWHIQPGTDQPNAFSLSADGGRTWGPTRSTGIPGQSTALVTWHDGEPLFIYNQRRSGEIGVWLARVQPSDAGFGVVSNERVWAAPEAGGGEIVAVKLAGVS